MEPLGNTKERGQDVNAGGGRRSDEKGPFYLHRVCSCCGDTHKAWKIRVIMRCHGGGVRTMETRYGMQVMATENVGVIVVNIWAALYTAPMAEWPKPGEMPTQWISGRSEGRGPHSYASGWQWLAWFRHVKGPEGNVQVKHT